MKIHLPVKTEAPRRDKSAENGQFLSVAAWLAALSLVLLAIILGWRLYMHKVVGGDSVYQVGLHSSSNSRATQVGAAALKVDPLAIPLPEYQPQDDMLAISRKSTLHTIAPSRPRRDVQRYTVAAGDSVFEIATKFQLKPESVLWGNYAQLKDNPDLISVGMVLDIPPTDGVLYEWQADDTLESVTARFDATPADILNWPGNDLDLSNPQIEPGTLILIPGGHREFRQWLIPTIPRGSAGVSSSVYGGGACSGSYDGAYGSGTFIWPAGNHSLSGNDYWSGHLGIDIAAGEGAAIYASDSGVVVFAGWATGGYGNTVIIDHGNGYQTLYAHMSSVATSCGRSVGQGAVVGYAGSTGNSTGAHLHFEVRYQGGFISPWYVLPAP